MQTLDLAGLFEELLDYRDQTKDFSSLGPWLELQVKRYPFPELHQFPFKPATYTRHCIAKEILIKNRPQRRWLVPGQQIWPHLLCPNDSQCFEALIICWDKWGQTPIHGHPSFSFYHVISGQFEMELFSLSATQRLQPLERRIFNSSDTTWCAGQPGRYDNFIHRVTCLEPGHTFHIYSDDAQKGVSLWAD